VLTSGALDTEAGAPLFFKCENLQAVGAFKARGAANAVFSLTAAAAARGVATHSSGNHAAALARAARLRGIPAYIVMPSNSPRSKVRNVERHGGLITFCEPTPEARTETCERIVEETGAAFIHPYENFDVMAGQGTAVLELLEDEPDLDVVLCPVGGGGLLAGTAVAAKSLRPAISVIAVEPEQADDAAQSFRAGRLVRRPVDTIADGLRTRRGRAESAHHARMRGRCRYGQRGGHSHRHAPDMGRIEGGDRTLRRRALRRDPRGPGPAGAAPHRHHPERRQRGSRTSSLAKEMRPTPPALLLTRSDIASVLSLDDCIAAVEAVFADHARGETIPPGLLHGDGGRWGISPQSGRPSSLRHRVTPARSTAAFSRTAPGTICRPIQGLILLYDAANGVPLAVAESGLITMLRTGAATAVAAKHLARADAATVTLCGAGVQGAMQLRALARVRPLRRISVWDLEPARAAEFAARMTPELGCEVRTVRDLKTASRASDIIVTCTPAKKWFLGREHVRSGTFVAAVGADSPDKQEIEPQLLASAVVVCDLLTQCAEVGDLHHALAEGLMDRAQVRGEIGAIIAGLAPGRRDDTETMIYDATGTALQDAAALSVAYDHAVASGRGTRFAFSS
jgi:ornithine cyclodeaminase/alanine dehydrogenase-like protein (mu-crystallin family)/cysteine synthase